MPLKDLLWACPRCHTVEGIGADGACRACNTRFRRGRGARIVATPTGGQAAEEADAPEWLARLPWGDLDGEGLAPPPGPPAPWAARVQVRRETRRLALRRAGTYLGVIEVFGKPQRGNLTLDHELLRFLATRGDSWVLPLTACVAVQPASSTIQLAERGGPVRSVRLLDGSVRLWEQRLKHAIRQAFRQAGRGEITEYQPRIRTR